MATPFYNGNMNLKSIGVPIHYTPEQTKEYLKCKEDPIYFIETYCNITSLDQGNVLFKMHPYQKRLVDAIHNNRFVMAKIGRQLGKTITVACYICHFVIFNDNKEVCILANKGSAAREVMSRIQYAYEFLPTWLQQGLKTWNKGDIHLENGSKIYTGATTPSGPRGKSIAMLYIDEAAIIENSVADEFFASTYPTISSGKSSKIIMTSTPLGYNHFWKMWNDSEQGRNQFVRVEAHYTEHPDRDEEWAQQQLENLGQLKFNQEVLCEWLGSSDTLISSAAIARLSATKPIYTNGGLDVFEKPIVQDLSIGTAGRLYVMVVDPSKGVGGDSSAFSIIDVTETPYRMVARFKDNRISPLLFPNLIHKLAVEYNRAYVLIEINASEQVAYILHHELEYENLLMIKRNSRGQEVSGGYAGVTLLYGVNTDKKIKRVGCSNFKALVEEQKLLIPDEVAISEISTFIQKKSSYEADDGYHDDVVMTLVLFGWLTTQPYFAELNDVNLRNQMFNQQMELIEQSLTPFGYILEDGNDVADDDILVF